MDIKKIQESYTFLLVHNIPKQYKASHLRNFFSELIETAAFRCFHFRHRPEVQKNSADDSSRSGQTCCCLVLIKNDRVNEMLAKYNETHWLNDEGETMKAKCFLRKVLIKEDQDTSLEDRYLTKGEKRDRRENPTLTASDVKNMIELQPPKVLPAGNVGTPTKYILKQINSCNFPAQLIGKLGIVFPRMRAKGMYGSVALDYASMEPKKSEDRINPEETKQPSENENIKDTPSASDDVHQDKSSAENTKSSSNDSSHESTPKESTSRTNNHKFKKPYPPKRKVDIDTLIPGMKDIPTFVRTSKGHVISDTEMRRKKELGGTIKDEERRGDCKEDGTGGDAEDNDDDDGEEWDRHESLHNDVTNQERTKERLFEEELEVVWEKGGSGLVFYTDAQVWDEQAGDFDAKTSDDWDLDMSGYYQDGAGDKDCRDMLSIQHFERLKDGKDDGDDNRVGYFEKYTKGFGRKVLEEYGWKSGQGVGKNEGIADPIEEVGQHPSDKAGLGFRGEKLVREKLKRKKSDNTEMFSSIFDERFRKEGHGLTGRSELPSVLKYRKKFVKNGSEPGCSKNQ